MKTYSRIAVLCIVVGALALTVAACGSGSAHPACIVMDASHSTRYALFDYTRRFRAMLEKTADAGGSLAVVVMTGNPIVESDIEQSADFGALTAVDQTSERAAAVDDFASGVDRSVRLASAGVRDPSPGSGIVAAIALIARQGCASVEVLSDGLEAADVHMKLEDIVSAKGRGQILDRLSSRELIPDLAGAELRFPLGGYLPQGTAISKARLDAVPKFWKAYADRANASLGWRE